MKLRLILRIYHISLIKDIFGLHDIMPLLTYRRGRHKVFITRFFVRKASFMIKLDIHTSCCGSLLKPLADIWDGSLLAYWNILYIS